MHLPPNVQDSVKAWLLPPSVEGSVQSYRSTYSLPPWLPNTCQFNPDVDQTSIASVDDDVSVSDSAHGSYSSESSSQTSWTSSTEFSDTFFDEDNKEQLPQLTKLNSYPVVESQEHELRGIQTNDQSVSGSSCTPCSLENICRNAKGRMSRFFRQTCTDGTQKRPQACSGLQGTDSSFVPNAQYWSTRRSACPTSRPCPPKLKRDTDVTELFVALLIIFAKRLITAIWPLSDRPPMMTDCFNGAGVLPLEAFIRETLRRSKTSFSTLQVALYYLILLKSRIPQGQFGARCGGETPERAQCRAMQCGRRMFLSALMLASKYLQDRNYSARAWSKISGLRSNEINENEREYLAQINYDLHVPKETFENWSKIVLVLSKLSNEPPSYRPGPFDANFGSPGAGSNTSLAAMVSQVDLDESFDFDQLVFTGEWWTAVLRKLEPGIVKEAPLVEDFLRTYLPSNKLHLIASLPHLSKQVNTPLDCSSPSSGSVAHGEDLNFGDTLGIRNSQPSRIQGVKTPQTPVQMSPAKGHALPSRPQLGNLPTPQTTPRIPDQSSYEKGCPRPFLRCAASMDAMRSLRKQCLNNANLERCPPPQPQNFISPPMKCLMRPAATIQELSIRTTTPLTSSPASVASDSTTTTASTSRSRSSSISSMSSWSSSAPTMPRLRKGVACGLSSPLSRVCSWADRSSQPASTSFQTAQPDFQDEGYHILTRHQKSLAKFDDEGYVDPARVLQANTSPTSSEVAAIHGLMSLSTQSETLSQSVTPTPQRLSEQGHVRILQCSERRNDHKRKLSKTELGLQAHVKDRLSDGSWSVDVVEDSLLPYFGTMHRQTQVPTSLRKENRRPLSTPMNNKRLCSLQHSSSTASAIPLSGGDHSILMCR